MFGSLISGLTVSIFCALFVGFNPKYILSRRKEIGSANPIETLHCIDKIEESVALQVQKIIDKNTNLSFLNCEIKRLLS